MSYVSSWKYFAKCWMASGSFLEIGAVSVILRLLTWGKLGKDVPLCILTDFYNYV
jgi:hypothetical protein